jgi:hypothetical protein
LDTGAGLGYDDGVTAVFRSDRRREHSMPLFLIERNFAEQLDLSPEAAAQVKLVNEEAGVNWLLSFLSADKKKTYCLYESSSAEAIREAARRAGIPADVIVEVSELHPEELLGMQNPG